MMKLYYKDFGPVATNSYLIIDESTNSAAVVDVPPDSSNFLLDKIREYKVDLVDIWLTHTHWDHTGEVYDLQQATNARVHVNKKDNHRLINPNDYTGNMLPFDIKPIKADEFVKEGDNLILGSLKFRVLESPGHTEGGILFVNDQEKKVFAGDTIFNGSIGRTDLPGGDFETMIKSIEEKILTLDDDYDLYVGHGPKTTVGKERKTNPFIRKYIYNG